MRHIFLFIMLGIFLLRALGFFSKRGNLRPPGPAMPSPSRIPNLLRPSAPVADMPSAPSLPSLPPVPFSGEPPRDPVGGWEGGLLQLAVTVGWVLGCAVLWSCLFGLQALQQFPLPARLAAGVLVSAVILALARTLIASAQTAESASQDPIR